MKLNVFLISAITFIAVSCTNTEPKYAVQRPNIILLMADDLGWGDPSYTGNAVSKTPNLDVMASEGIRFNRFYASSPVCSPTRGSCITGRHPYRYGIFFANTGHMLKEEFTLAEALKTKGYVTGHFGKWHLGTLTKTELDANRGGRVKFRDEYSPPWENGFDICFSTESKVPTWNPMITPSASAGDIGKRTPGKPFGTAYWTGMGQKVEGGVRVPGIMLWPDVIKQNIVTDIPFSTLDYFPTIMEITGFSDKGAPKLIDGVSMLPLINGVMKERPAPIGFESKKQADL